MKDNLDIFPAAILDKDQYNKFYILIDNYKKENYYSNYYLKYILN